MKRLRKLDYLIIVPYLMLCAIGIVMVYSASANVAIQNGSSPTAYLIKQVMWVIVGMGLTGFVTAMNFQKWQTKVVIIGGFGVFLLFFIYLLAKGKTVNGAAGWISFGPINLQPAEFVKFYLIILVAHALASPKRESELLGGHWWWTMRGPLIISAILTGLVFIQPDMGSASIITAIIYMMCLASGISVKRGWKIIGATFAGIVFVAFPIALKLSESGIVKSYKLARLVAFVDPFGHAKDTGQQLVNSYYALSNGGLFGVGLGNSIQKRGYLPEPNTDFIMAITGEELGLFAVIGILLLLGLIVWRTIKIGMHADNVFDTLVCYGVATYYAVQASINVGGVVGFLPITGVTFPFISYGGSSMLSLTLCLGLVLNVSARERGKKEK
ncbi:FtsW/RodA/SpoVE family cell cycle protein [Secundilactobacillus muriivasis]